MDSIKNIASSSKNREEMLDNLLEDYIEFRKNFLIEEIESAAFFILKKYFKTEDHSISKWSSVHFYLNSDSKDHNQIKKTFLSYFEDSEKALEYINNAMNQIAKYRCISKDYVNNDIQFLMSYLAVYSSEDYMRFSKLEDIILKE